MDNLEALQAVHAIVSQSNEAIEKLDKKINTNPAADEYIVNGHGLRIVRAILALHVEILTEFVEHQERTQEQLKAFSDEFQKRME